MQLSLEQISRWVGAQAPASGSDVLITGVSTDSRSISPGDLFIPLRGERYDGHHYLAVAIDNGAAACLSEEIVDADVPVLQVEDSLRALGDIASCWRHRFELPVAAITGSCGKTTTKEMLAAIMSETGKGLKTAGNFNNLIGLPLTLFRLDAEDRWAVLELGMNRRGEISRLTEISDPAIGVITNVGPGHLEGLGDLDGVARAKGELFAHLRTGSVAVVNADDERIINLPIANGVDRVTFGFSASADIQASELAPAVSGYQFSLKMAGESRQVELSVPGRHNVSNALAAAAVAAQFNVSLDSIVCGLEKFRSEPGRMVLTEESAGWTILEDYYNANPLSMRAALETLAESNNRKIAVLGDMLELGVEASALHREIGTFAAGRVDRLILLGAHARDVAGGAMAAGLDEKCIDCVADHHEAFERLRAFVKSGDRILLKGSRGMKMEQIVEMLRNQHGLAEGS